MNKPIQKFPLIDFQINAQRIRFLLETHGLSRFLYFSHNACSFSKLTDDQIKKRNILKRK